MLQHVVDPQHLLQPNSKNISLLHSACSLPGTSAAAVVQQVQRISR
jgi:hypothetical protein